MRRNYTITVRHLAVVLVILSITEGVRADAGIEARKEGLLGIVVADAASNRLIGKATVDIRRLGGIPYCLADSDANGVAWIRLAPGGYEVLGAVCEGYTYEGQRQVVAVEQGATKRVVMALTPNLHGVVRDSYKVPLVGAWISVVGAGRV
jgi:hypothetical protein